MAAGVGHTGGLTNPRPWRGRCRAGYFNTGGPPLPRKRAPLQKKPLNDIATFGGYFFLYCICFQSRLSRARKVNESNGLLEFLGGCLIDGFGIYKPGLEEQRSVPGFVEVAARGCPG